MAAPSILVVDNEKGMRDFLSIALSRGGYRVTAAGSGEEALAVIATEPFDLVITDIRMKGVDGLGVLQGVRERSPEVPVVLITAYASPDTAIEAMKLGAYDYITKPFKPEQLTSLVARALDDRREKAGGKVAREVLIKDEPHLIIGDSPAILEICKTIGRVADSRSTVLIRGESGTGKELVARAIHQYSQRRGAPFVVVNCGALSEELLASELFGHVKGSFTGAVSDKPGLLEIASGGTFFFDEIGDTPLAVQVKLLRVLQEQEFRRVGGTTDLRVDVRIIAATNQDLESKIESGLFREDLFYRLNVITMTLPPLRKRTDDIPHLVDYFIRRYRRRVPGAPGRISQKALDRLIDYPWPGNVRQLENAVERALVLETGDVITERSLPRLSPDVVPAAEAVHSAPPVPSALPAGGIDLPALFDDLERFYVTQALAAAGGLSPKAAALLGLKPRAFRYLLSKHGLSVHQFRRNLAPERQLLPFPALPDDGLAKK
jgi:two-component system response regulator PilR (NtrC family)